MYNSKRKQADIRSVLVFEYVEKIDVYNTKRMRSDNCMFSRMCFFAVLCVSLCARPRPSLSPCPPRFRGALAASLSSFCRCWPCFSWRLERGTSTWRVGCSTWFQNFATKTTSVSEFLLVIFASLSFYSFFFWSCYICLSSGFPSSFPLLWSSAFRIHFWIRKQNMFLVRNLIF